MDNLYAFAQLDVATRDHGSTTSPSGRENVNVHRVAFPFTAAISYDHPCAPISSGTDGSTFMHPPETYVVLHAGAVSTTTVPSVDAPASYAALFRGTDDGPGRRACAAHARRTSKTTTARISSDRGATQTLCVAAVTDTTAASRRAPVPTTACLPGMCCCPTARDALCVLLGAALALFFFYPWPLRDAPTVDWDDLRRAAQSVVADAARAVLSQS